MNLEFEIRAGATYTAEHSAVLSACLGVSGCDRPARTKRTVRFIGPRFFDGRLVRPWREYTGAVRTTQTEWHSTLLY